MLVLSALRHKPHPSHATVEQAVEWARRIGARQTWFTHIAHELGHEETNRMLPAGVGLAYDGLTVPVTYERLVAWRPRFPFIDRSREIAAGFGPSRGRHRQLRRRAPGAPGDSCARWWRRRAARARGRLRSPSIRTRSSFCVRQQAPQLLTPMAERLRLLAATGIDAVLVLPFDAALARVAGAGVCAASSGGGAGRARLA